MAVVDVRNLQGKTVGQVELADATAHWWILKDEPAISNNSGFIESAGHVAALYQSELYELATARASQFFEQRIANWDSGKKEDRPRWDTEVVATAATLAIQDSLTAVSAATRPD